MHNYSKKIKNVTADGCNCGYENYCDIVLKYKILLNNSMLVNYSLDSIESENASNSVTLVPRLDYSVNLLTGIIEILQEKRIELKNLN